MEASICRIEFHIDALTLVTVALPGVLRAARIPVGNDTENKPVFRVSDHECIGEFSSGCPKRGSQLFLYEPILAGQRGSCVEELPLKKPELFDMHDT